jgi:hypothetical protein
MTKKSLLLAAVVTAALSAAAPGVAQAASIHVTFNAELVEGVPALVTADYTGNTPSDDIYARVYVIPAGGSGCAPTSSTNQGDSILASDSQDANAHGSDTEPYTPGTPGDYIACGYLSPFGDSDHPQTTSATPFHVRLANATLQISQASIAAGTTVALGATFQTEANRELYVDYRPTGAPCAATYLQDRQTGVIVVNGHDLTGSGAYSFTFSAPTTAGSYIVCGYIQGSADDTTPDATTTSTFSVIPSACDRATADLVTKQQKATAADSARSTALARKRSAQVKAAAAKRSYLRATHARHRSRTKIARLRTRYRTLTASYRKAISKFTQANTADSRANNALTAAQRAKDAVC